MCIHSQLVYLGDDKEQFDVTLNRGKNLSLEKSNGFYGPSDN